MEKTNGVYTILDEQLHLAGQFGLLAQAVVAAEMNNTIYSLTGKEIHDLIQASNRQKSAYLERRLDQIREIVDKTSTTKEPYRLEPEQLGDTNGIVAKVVRELGRIEFLNLDKESLYVSVRENQRVVITEVLKVIDAVPRRLNYYLNKDEGKAEIIAMFADQLTPEGNRNLKFHPKRKKLVYGLLRQVVKQIQNRS